MNVELDKHQLKIIIGWAEYMLEHDDVSNGDKITYINPIYDKLLEALNKH